MRTCTEFCVVLLLALTAPADLQSKSRHASVALVHVPTAGNTLTFTVAMIQEFAGLLQVALLGSCAPLKLHTSYNLEWQVHGASAVPAPHRAPANGLEPAEVLHRSWASREAPDENDAVKTCEDLGFLLRQLELTEIWRHSEISLRCPFFALSEAPKRHKWSGRARGAVEVDIGVFRSALERGRQLDTGTPLALAPREMAADGETSSENTPITVRPAVRVSEQGSYPMERYSSPSLGHGAQRQPIASFVSEVPASAFQTPLSSCGNGAILTGEKSFSFPQ